MTSGFSTACSTAEQNALSVFTGSEGNRILPGCLQSILATLEHAPPHIMEPWRIELHTLSLRRTNAALEHEAPKKMHPECQSAAGLRESCLSGTLGNRILHIDPARVNRLLGTWGPEM